jgi:hypothetical protein
MKKIILVFALILGISSANAQFTASVNAGAPVGDIEEFSSFALSADVSYAFPTKKDIKFGVSAGFINYFGKDYDLLGVEVQGDSNQFLPISGFTTVRLTNTLSLGTKLGYAIGLTDNDAGGFYYKPMLGFIVGNNTNLSLFYEGISNDMFNPSNLGVGIIFGI